MQDLISLLSGIDAKVSSLQGQTLQFKQEIRVLKAKIHEQETIIDNNQKKITELENKNSILKIGGSVNTTGKASLQAKQTINELVREIDKCIKLLDS